MKRVLSAAAGLVIAATLHAQQPPAGCTAAEYRQFDFWVGEWTVTDSAGGTVMGNSVVTSEERGCLVHERWTAPGGGTGQSFNAWERQGQQWSQFWVGSLGNVVRLAGRFDGRSMVLEGEQSRPGGARVRNRITWTPQPDGRVRQVWTVSQDDGASWQTSFDGWYRRRT